MFLAPTFLALVTDRPSVWPVCCFLRLLTTTKGFWTVRRSIIYVFPIKKLTVNKKLPQLTSSWD